MAPMSRICRSTPSKPHSSRLRAHHGWPIAWPPTSMRIGTWAIKSITFPPTCVRPTPAGGYMGSCHKKSASRCGWRACGGMDASDRIRRPASRRRSETCDLHHLLLGHRMSRTMERGRMAIQRHANPASRLDGNLGAEARQRVFDIGAVQVRLKRMREWRGASCGDDNS